MKLIALLQTNITKIKEKNICETNVKSQLGLTVLLLAGEFILYLRVREYAPKYIKMKRLTTALSLIILLGTACTKEGKGGKASIKGQVLHHDEQIVNAVIYIAYGAKELPEHHEDYDETIIASGTDASYVFTELKKGNYYIYAEGYSDKATEDVIGGIPITISTNDDIVNSNIPVTEGVHGH